MQKDISIIKGIHPGIVLERELSIRNLSKRSFALSIGEYPQTISAITKGKRDMNAPLSLKIENVLNIEEGYFMILQVYYNIRKLKQQSQVDNHPDLSLIRSSLFWDTDIHKIQWELQRKSVIKRVFERGNEQEKSEIKRFYGLQIVEDVLRQLAGEKGEYTTHH